MLPLTPTAGAVGGAPQNPVRYQRPPTASSGPVAARGAKRTPGEAASAPPKRHSGSRLQWMSGSSRGTTILTEENLSMMRKPEELVPDPATRRLAADFAAAAPSPGARPQQEAARRPHRPKDPSYMLQGLPAGFKEVHNRHFGRPAPNGRYAALVLAPSAVLRGADGTTLSGLPPPFLRLRVVQYTKAGRRTC